MSGINSSEATIQKLQHLSGECSVYSILGQSRSVLKMVMSVQYSLQNMLSCVEQKLGRLDQLQQLWTDNMKLTYRAFQAENPEPASYLEKIQFYETLGKDISLIPNMLECGILLIKTDNVKVNMAKLAKQWKEIYATNLNGRVRLEL